MKALHLTLDFIDLFIFTIQNEIGNFFVIFIFV